MGTPGVALFTHLCIWTEENLKEIMKKPLLIALLLTTLSSASQAKPTDLWIPYPHDAFPYSDNLLNKEIEKYPLSPWPSNVLMSLYETALYARHQRILACLNEVEKKNYLEDHERWLKNLDDETKDLWKPWIHGVAGQISGAKIKTKKIRSRLEEISPLLRISNSGCINR